MPHVAQPLSSRADAEVTHAPIASRAPSRCQAAGVYRARRPDAGTWRRRGDRHVLRRPRRPPQTLALRAPARTGLDVRQLQRGRLRGGVSAGLPRLPGPAARVRVAERDDDWAAV